MFFFQKTALRTHMKKHEDKTHRQYFTCHFPGCKIRNSDESALRHHIRFVHELKRTFDCYCGSKFTTGNGLRLHQKRVHERKFEVKCEICSKLFVHKSDMEAHKRITHDPNYKPKKVTCDVCAQQFPSMTALRKHMNNHGDPQFSCQHCDKKFYQHEHLLDHQQYHETLAFPCQHCDRSYRKEALLNWHLKRVHFKEKRTYRCEICSSTFTRRTTCRDHVLRQHKNLDVNFRNDLLERISKMLPEEHEGGQN
jgi:hypothetical protein